MSADEAAVMCSTATHEGYDRLWHLSSVRCIATVLSEIGRISDGPSGVTASELLTQPRHEAMEQNFTSILGFRGDALSHLVDSNARLDCVDCRRSRKLNVALSRRKIGTKCHERFGCSDAVERCVTINKIVRVSG